MKDFFKVAPRPSTTDAASGTRKCLLARDFVLWVARDLLPFSLVDGQGLRVSNRKVTAPFSVIPYRFILLILHVTFYCQDFLVKYRVVQKVEDLPDRTTLSRGALSDVYSELRLKVKDLLSSASFCALTFDLWTDSYRRKGFITFTCHFCDGEYLPV